MSETETEGEREGEEEIEAEGETETERERVGRREKEGGEERFQRRVEIVYVLQNTLRIKIRLK